MTKFSQSRFLEETLTLLITHFGADEVSRVLKKVAPKSLQSEGLFSVTSNKQDNQEPTSRPNIRVTLDKIKKQNTAQFDLLNVFLERLRLQAILPGSEDIRQFASLTGLKEIHGKSRRDMIPALIEFLATLPIERLQEATVNAETISEKNRREGFSVLTDKLMNGL